MSKMTVEDNLSNLAPDLQSTTRELCTLARKNMPGAYEFIYHDAVGYSVNDLRLTGSATSLLKRGY
jgi:hypothetical protein